MVFDEEDTVVDVVLDEGVEFGGFGEDFFLRGAGGAEFLDLQIAAEVFAHQREAGDGALDAGVGGAVGGGAKIMFELSGVGEVGFDLLRGLEG